MMAAMILLYYCYFSSPAGLAQEKSQEPDAHWNQVKTLASMGELLQDALRCRYYSEEGRVSDFGRESLRALTYIGGIRVSVPPKVEDCGLSAEAVKTMIELQLRRNGIDLLDDLPTEPNERYAWVLAHHVPPYPLLGMSELLVAIDSVSNDSARIIAASVVVSQSQPVNLLSTRTPSTMIITTWQYGHTVLADRAQVAEVCRNALNQSLEAYCNDWLATHPRSQTGSPSTRVDNGPEKKRD